MKNNLLKISSTRLRKIAQEKKVSTFFILPRFLTLAEKHIDFFNKKCKKLGLEPITMEVGEKKSLFDSVLNKNVTKILVKITGDAPIQDGWEFIAEVSHVKNDKGEFSNIVKKIDNNIEIPQKYYSVTPECEHCNMKRSRLTTYILRDVYSGELVQVGSTCIDDFLPNSRRNLVSLFMAWSFLEDLSDVSDVNENGYGMMGGGSRNFDMISVLSLTSCLVEQMGYNKSTHEQSTKNIVSTIFSGTESAIKLIERLEDTGVHLQPSEKNDIEALNALNWARGLSEEEKKGNDYLSNISGASHLSVVSPKFLGLVVSIIPSYKRFKMRERKEEELKKHDTPFVGNYGDDVTLDIIVETMKGPYRNGTSMLYVGRAEGNKLVKWWGNPNEIKFEKGKPYTVNGKVKATIRDKYLQNLPVTEIAMVTIVDPLKNNQIEKNSDVFIGEEGKMIDLVNMEVVDFKSFNNDYGVSTLYYFVSSDGKKAKGFISRSNIVLSVGSIYNFRAKIKEHEPLDRYESCPMTILSHIKNVDNIGESERYKNEKKKTEEEFVNKGLNLIKTNFFEAERFFSKKRFDELESEKAKALLKLFYCLKTILRSGMFEKKDLNTKQFEDILLLSFEGNDDEFDNDEFEKRYEDCVKIIGLYCQLNKIIIGGLPIFTIFSTYFLNPSLRDLIIETIKASDKKEEFKNLDIESIQMIDLNVVGDIYLGQIMIKDIIPTYKQILNNLGDQKDNIVGNTIHKELKSGVRAWATYFHDNILYF